MYLGEAGPLSADARKMKHFSWSPTRALHVVLLGACLPLFYVLIGPCLLPVV